MRAEIIPADALADRDAAIAHVQARLLAMNRDGPAGNVES
jgi:hypothetical protein